MIIILPMILTTISVKFKASFIDELPWAGLALRHGAKYMDIPRHSPVERRNRKQRCMIKVSAMILMNIAMKFKASFIGRLAWADLALCHSAKHAEMQYIGPERGGERKQRCMIKISVSILTVLAALRIWAPHWRLVRAALMVRGDADLGDAAGLSASSSPLPSPLRLAKRRWFPVRDAAWCRTLHELAL